MSAPGPADRAGATVGPADIRAMRRLLADAGDRQVLKIVGFVDSLAERGDVDALLDPIRHRLRVLRPLRPMPFTRFLFAPLNAVIVSPKGWRSDGPMLPRTALAPFDEVVRANLGGAVEALQVELRGIDGDDLSAINSLGAIHWPRAGQALGAGQMPRSWTAQGLPASAFAPLRDAVAFILDTEPSLADLAMVGTPQAAIEAGLTGLLARAEAVNPQCWGMLLTLLLQRFPAAAAPFNATRLRRQSAPAAAMARVALGAATDWIEASSAVRGPPDLDHGPTEISRQVALLDCLSAQPEMHGRARELRDALQIASIARFEVGLQDFLTIHLADHRTEDAVTDMDAAAFGLRRLETEARRLGGGPAYDRMLTEAADQIMAAPGLDRWDRIRLVEILAGPQAALRASKALPS